MIYQDLSKFRLNSAERGRSAFVVQLWWLIRAIFFSTSPQFLYGWRRWLLKLFGAKIGNGVLIRPSVRITYPWKLIIGDNAWIGDHAEIYNLSQIIIGNNAVVSQGCYLCAGTHDYKQLDFPQVSREIVIEDEVWLAAQVFVMPGVNVGRGAVVGARSMVTKNVRPAMICLGTPAIEVSERRGIVQAPSA